MSRVSSSRPIPVEPFRVRWRRVSVSTRRVDVGGQRIYGEIIAHGRRPAVNEKGYLKHQEHDLKGTERIKITLFFTLVIVCVKNKKKKERTNDFYFLVTNTPRIERRGIGRRMIVQLLSPPCGFATVVVIKIRLDAKPSTAGGCRTHSRKIKKKCNPDVGIRKKTTLIGVFASSGAVGCNLVLLFV